MRVAFGKGERQVRIENEEDGEVFYRSEDCYYVSFTTPRGHEWTHLHSFPFTPAGERSAARLTALIQAVLDEKGTDGLQDRFWSVRTKYGSLAYQDEEPDIVAREKSDALLGGM